MNFDALADRVLEGGAPTKAEAHAVLASADEELDGLLLAARRVREAAFGREVHIHVLQNAKSGLCSEDCSFCSQSVKHDSEVPRYKVQTVETLVAGAHDAVSMGAKRYCMVTSTRRPSEKELQVICEATRRIKAELDIDICASLGKLVGGDAETLVEAGVNRFNHNLETSENYYPEVVSTHTWQSRVDTVKAAKAAGLEACCGGIMGLGEAAQDRVDLAFSLRALEVESIPVNFLDARPGTPLAHVERMRPEDALRSLCMFRFVNPRADLRVAGGREKILGEHQGRALYPANSIFCNGYLTTGGQGFERDVAMIEAAGFKVALQLPSVA